VVDGPWFRGGKHKEIQEIIQLQNIVFLTLIKVAKGKWFILLAVFKTPIVLIIINRLNKPKRSY